MYENKRSQKGVNLMNTEEYKKEISKLLDGTQDKGLLDLIHKLLVKSVQIVPQ